LFYNDNQAIIRCTKSTSPCTTRTSVYFLHKHVYGLDISFNIVDALFNFVNIWRVDKRVFFCASQSTLSMGSTIHSYAVYIRSIFSKTL